MGIRLPLKVLLIVALVVVVFVCASVTLAVAVLAVGYRERPEGLPQGISGQVVFVGDRDGVQGLYVSDLGTGEVASIATEPGEYGYPAYSPDGRKVAFSRDHDLYVMDAEGGEARVVASGPGKEYNPAWSPDGGRIAYACEDRGAADVCIVGVEGGKPRNLTGPETQDYDPAWSPDGGRIAFSTGGEIRVMRLDGPGVVRVTEPIHEPVERYDPDWSPTGEEIVYSSNRTGYFQIHYSAASGEKQCNLTDGWPQSFTPAYSPDGEWVVFSSGPEGTGELRVAGSDRLTRDNTGPLPGPLPENARQPDWRPGPAPGELEDGEFLTNAEE